MTSNDNESMVCKICNKYFNDPRVLTCSHTYCFQCILEKSSPVTRAFTCPMNDETIVPRQYINSLPKRQTAQDDPSDDTDGTGSTVSDADIDERNVIYISGLPTNIPDRELVDVLNETFRDCGSIKVITIKYIVNQSKNRMIWYIVLSTNK